MSHHKELKTSSAYPFMNCNELAILLTGELTNSSSIQEIVTHIQEIVILIEYQLIRRNSRNSFPYKMNATNLFFLEQAQQMINAEEYFLSLLYLKQFLLSYPSGKNPFEGLASCYILLNQLKKHIAYKIAN